VLAKLNGGTRLKHPTAIDSGGKAYPHLRSDRLSGEVEMHPVRRGGAADQAAVLIATWGDSNSGPSHFTAPVLHAVTTAVSRRTSTVLARVLRLQYAYLADVTPR
jgi:hypothetical protein